LTVSSGFEHALSRKAQKKVFGGLDVCPETPCSSKSEPSIFGLLAGLTAAWRVITSSKPYFAASTREMSQCADLICTRILRRFRGASASFNPTPNFPMPLPAFLAFRVLILRQVFIVDTRPKVSDMPVTRAICADDDILGVRQHLFIECVRYHLRIACFTFHPSRIFSIFKSKFRGSFVCMPTESLHLATFVAVMRAQDQSLG
jgi:hypothetical protein